MTYINTNLPARAEAYFSGKEQLVRSLTALANHLHNPPRELRRTPESITAGDITQLRQAYYKLTDMADGLGLELPCLEI